MATRLDDRLDSTSAVPADRAHPVGRAAHLQAVQTLLDAVGEIPADRPLRLAKSTSNLFRPRGKGGSARVQVTGLDSVIEITVDPESGSATADVQGMCTYERLVATTLPLGWVPLVVPQLRSITLGGAVTGLGIESTSFRNGLPHESVIEMDILTAQGIVVTASAGNEHQDLFRAFPNSYGSLGYALRLRILLEPAPARVGLRNVRFGDLGTLVATVGGIVESGHFEGDRVDYLDGVVFSPEEAYLILGRGENDSADPSKGQGSGAKPSDYTGATPYFRSIAARTTDSLTFHDYLWRWDTDWFWCSRAFGAQNPSIRRLWPARWRRSDVYHRLVGLENRFHVVAGVERLRGLPARERVVQDVEIPLETTEQFLAWFLRTVPMTPIWLCPVRLRSDTPWPLYPMTPGLTYVNIGFWGTVPIQRSLLSRGQDASDLGLTNRQIEARVSALGGHKSLYSDSYYSPDEFRRLYPADSYDSVRSRYDPAARLLDLYAKTVQRR